MVGRNLIELIEFCEGGKVIQHCYRRNFHLQAQKN